MVWKNFIEGRKRLYFNIRRQLLEISPPLLRFILDLALRIDTVLSRRHWDVDDWVFHRDVTDAPYVDQTLRFHSPSSPSSSSLVQSLISGVVSPDLDLEGHRGDCVVSPLKTISIPHDRIDVPPLPSQKPSRQHLRKWHLAHLLAASLVGLICPDHTGNCDINGYRRFGNKYTFAGWLFNLQGTRNEKMKCFVGYFSILQDLCKGHVTELASHPKMQEIVTIERVVGIQLFEGSGDLLLFKDGNRGRCTTGQTLVMASAQQHCQATQRSPLIKLRDAVDEWSLSSERLSPVEVIKDRKIEDCDGCLQADFANKRFGGGTLEGGMVQEEILFCIYPELLPLILLCPQLDSNEAFIVSGVERYVEATGYSTGFRCLGPANRRVSSTQLRSPLNHGGRFAMAPFDLLNHKTLTGVRRRISMAVIDALNVSKNTNLQYTLPAVVRELMKCSTALSANLAFPFREQPKLPFATGNWGCGAFCGDPQLKFMIQWIAASQLERPMLYCPFSDKRVLQLNQFIRFIMEKEISTVGALFRLLVRSLNKVAGESLWESIIRCLSVASDKL